MRRSQLISLSVLGLASLVRGLPSSPQQHVLSFSAGELARDQVSDSPTVSLAPIATNEGTGHFSEWSRLSKNQFLEDLSRNQADDWVLVLGNEGGDLDSMASALTWAYHLSHLDKPQKAIALLQTEEDALDLRPENQLALHYARMATKHRDLLTIDELPVKPWDMYHRIKGIALVDHSHPRTMWQNATILSIIDHHQDTGIAPDAKPRIIEKSASCTSLVAEHILDRLEEQEARGVQHVDGQLHGPLPFEMVELLLRAIALDSGGLKKGASQDVDRRSAQRLLERSSWKGRGLKGAMKELNRDLAASKKALETLTVRDLLRRDWKGDAIVTSSKQFPHINLGLASIPYSMNEQIRKTPEQTAPEWFAVERAFTAEIGADVSVVLTNHRDPITQEKRREIALVVAHGWGKRLDELAAERLFEQLKRAIEEAPELPGLEQWVREDGKELLPRRVVWTHRNKAGRKIMRPIVERALKEWTG